MALLRTVVPSALFAAVTVVAGCNRHDDAAAPGSATPTSADATPTREGMSASAAAAASTPLPVSPAGSTNASTAAQGNDLSNSTRATGNSNVYQPPSTNNPAPAASASGAASSNAQTTSSQTLGTSVPPNDGTLPTGTTGSTGARRGGGKN